MISNYQDESNLFYTKAIKNTKNVKGGEDDENRGYFQSTTGNASDRSF